MLSLHMTQPWVKLGSSSITPRRNQGNCERDATTIMLYSLDV